VAVGTVGHEDAHDLRHMVFDIFDGFVDLSEGVQEVSTAASPDSVYVELVVISAVLDEPPVTGAVVGQEVDELEELIAVLRVNDLSDFLCSLLAGIHRRATHAAGFVDHDEQKLAFSGFEGLTVLAYDALILLFSHLSCVLNVG